MFTEDPLEQELVQRTRTHVDPAIQSALNALGQDVNPVKVVGPEEIQKLYSTIYKGDGMPDMRVRQSGLGGFRVPNDPNIYVNAESPTYRAAVKNPNDTAAAIMLAGILAHEQTHDTEGAELAPRRIEADFLRSKLGEVGWRKKSMLLDRIKENETIANAQQRKPNVRK